MTAEIFLLAVASMFWPLLLLVDVVALRTPRPVGILAWFLAGGFLTTIGLGLAIVYALRSSSRVSSSSKTSTDAAVYIVVGCLALVAALLVWRGRNHAPASGERSTSGSDRIERLVARGAALSFVAGIVANVFPGVFPFIALKDIAELSVPFAATLGLIIGFYVVMFTFVEAPLLAFLIAPSRTELAVASFNRWLARHGRALATSALLVVGVLELVHGIVVAN